MNRDELSTWFLSRAAPLPLVALPDYGNETTRSPAYTRAPMGMTWRAADATQDYARIAFKLPAGLDPARPLIVRGLMFGTAVSENIIIKTSSTSLSVGDSTAFSTSNNTEQSSIAIAANLVEVTIVTITPAAAGDTIMLAFRPRTTGDANVTQNKTLLNLWLV